MTTGTEMPILESARLLVRPFGLEDLADVHRLLDVELRQANLHSEKMESLAERAQWLQWTVFNYTQLAMLYQPPYGDRAIVLKPSGALIGACGFVPCLNAFEQLPGWVPGGLPAIPGRNSAEVGLFYAISPAYQRQGYAAEAAQVLVDYAFQRLRLKRVLATTDYDNAASQGVMRKLGMRILRNPSPEPPWLQVVGILDNP